MPKTPSRVPSVSSLLSRECTLILADLPYPHGGDSGQWRDMESAASLPEILPRTASAKQDRSFSMIHRLPGISHLFNA